MDPRAYRIAQEFVRTQVRQVQAKGELWQEFLNELYEGGQKQVRNTNKETQEQFPTVKTVTLLRNDAGFYKLLQGQFARWRQQRGEGGGKPEGVQEEAPKQKKPQTPEEITARNVDIVKNGKEVARIVLSSGGRGAEDGINESFIVQLKKDGQTQNFIHKPAKGETPHIRIGIPAGQYHSREQATYSIDAMMGGRGVVPVTHTRGKDDGSYQLWAKGAKAMHSKDLDHLIDKVPVEDLEKSPSFQRVNVMDLLLGHEDRHRGNLLYRFDGDETPENLQFIAIDNGLSMADPAEDRDYRVYESPFLTMHKERTGKDDRSPEEQKTADEFVKKGNDAVAKSLSNITPELHKQIKSLDLSKVATAMTSAGVDGKNAVRAALVRIAAVQEDPKIFEGILDRHDGDLGTAWRDFQHLSGQGDDLLWRAGADRETEINAAVAQSKPQGGWVKGMSSDDTFKAMAELEKWGQDVDSEADTAKPEPKAAPDKPVPDLPKTAPNIPNRGIPGKVALNVRDRWLVSFVKLARGRTLTISEVNPRNQRKRVVGVFELDRDNKVKESYKDHRFRRDIQRGIRLLGRKFVPSDGPKFMGALEKVYGPRSLYDVKRT